MTVGHKCKPLNKSTSIWILLAFYPSTSVLKRVIVVNIDDHFVLNLFVVVRAASEECVDKLFNFFVCQFYNRMLCSFKSFRAPVI